MSRFGRISDNIFGGRLVDPPGFGSNRAGRQEAFEVVPGVFVGGGGGGGRAKTNNGERRAARAAANQNIATRP